MTVRKNLHGKKLLAGEKAFNKSGEWLPQETLDTIRRVFNCD